jgi:hypothetical protein
MLHVLSAQRADAEQLAEDARQRGWTDEASRHVELVDRLDAVIARTGAA